MHTRYKATEVVMHPVWDSVGTGVCARIQSLPLGTTGQHSLLINRLCYGKWNLRLLHKKMQCPGPAVVPAAFSLLSANCGSEFGTPEPDWLTYAVAILGHEVGRAIREGSAQVVTY